MKPRTLIGMLIAGKELREIMSAQNEMLKQVVVLRDRDTVESARHNRDMIFQFLIALDQPETHDALRETLHEAHTDLSDHVARLEEHVG